MRDYGSPEGGRGGREYIVPFVCVLVVFLGEVRVAVGKSCLMCVYLYYYFFLFSLLSEARGASGLGRAGWRIGRVG